jgi:hypothetical protein
MKSSYDSNIQITIDTLPPTFNVSALRSMPVGKIPSDSKAFQYLQQHGTLPVKALRKTGKQSPKVEAKWSLNLTDARHQRHLGKASPTDVLSPDKLWMCTPYNADWGLDQAIGALNVRLHHHDCTTNDCTTLR